MNINEALEYIHNVKWQGSKLGLERTFALLESLGNPQKSLKFVHVAGTNGKGSTSACIASILQTAGYKTGLYISPYIMCFNERMQVNGEYITDEELIRVTEEIRPIADAMADSPTEFEIVTALAMKFFLNQKCDIVVLEVGMGGRLDSTNVIDTPELAVITAIGYDHVEYLGPTIADIAREKAGVIKSGGDVLVYGGEPEIEDVFEKISKERNAKLYKADFSRISVSDYALDGTRLSIAPHKDLKLPLMGTYQPNNATVAITAVEILRNKGYEISDEAIKTGIASVKWPGRFEVLGESPVFILDGAHNPQGAQVTVESLKEHFNGQKITFVIGVMADKDVDEIVIHLAPFAKVFIAVRPDYYRAMNADELAEKLGKYNIPVLIGKSVNDGVALAMEKAGKSGIVCAVGSLYFSSEIRNAHKEFRENCENSA